jgi:SAM-dependent methyltransferase
VTWSEVIIAYSSQTRGAVAAQLAAATGGELAAPVANSRRTGIPRSEVCVVTVKDLVRPLPMVRRLSLLRQRVLFRCSATYWEQNYARGGTSGPGSYGCLAEGKAAFLNEFVREHGVRSVIEFGCGDGHQLSLANYPRYVGLDVSPAAIRMCERRFAGDATMSFFRYDGACFVDRGGWFSADLAISLDVIYHLVEDAVFEAHMRHLFGAAQRFVIIYATDTRMGGTAPHVRHRHFSPWVSSHSPQWRLVQVVPGPNSGPGRADFFIYQRLGTETRR